jgi:hypothetical protein
MDMQNVQRYDILNLVFENGNERDIEVEDVGEMVLIDRIDDLIDDFELFFGDFVIESHLIDELRSTVGLLDEFRNIASYFIM